MFGKNKVKDALKALRDDVPKVRNYYAGVIRINVKEHLPEVYQDTVKKCFTLIQKYDGDMNVFLGGIILALWGVPMCFKTDKENSLKFFNELESSELPVSAILLSDIGHYGSFGDETRLTVTAVSNNIFDAIKVLIANDDKIFINKAVV
jgi:hypothetical protein